MAKRRPKGAVYVIARNNSGRPTLQHKLPPGVASFTSCGTEMIGWSRAYQAEAIEEILCRKRACRE